ncbi:visinin-like protein 1 [Haliotis rufescens]|uniref:visinin-like protein 1 n=1 Tax=Haliotis rufescens TaxID=6454 RepID=UPI00201F057F|nr:visinin-like protein 1 [Haliotis rufescens]
MFQYALLLLLPCVLGGTDPVSEWVHHLNQETENLWKTLDYNHNGKFDRDDVQTFLHDYDTDGDGEVTRVEFDFHWGMTEPTLNIVGHGLFLEYDDDQSGIVTSSDLDALYNRMDQNDDGNVSKGEFKTYYTELLTVLFILQTQHIENQLTTTPAPST